MASKYSIALVGDASGAVRAVKATSSEVDKLNKDLEKSDGLFVDVRNNLNSIGTIAAASLAGVATAAGLFTESTISQAAEVERLSAISNSASDEFQKYAASARLLGVEQDKLADIFKDTNDKIGDFLQTGGGPLKDFFDNIAPQVGVTADQFKKLSGPQALELYVSSLEKAGVSQNEMTFFMEALASDATLLLPLLQNNAEGFKVLGQSVEEAGAIMDGKTIAAAQQLNATLFLLDQGTEGFKNQLRAEMIPVLSDLAFEFFDLSTNSAIAEVAADALGGTIKGITGVAVGAVATFDLLGKSLGALYATADGLFDGVTVEDFLFSPNLVAKLRSNADKAKEVFTLTTDDLSETALAYADTLNNVFSAGENEGDGASNGVNQKIQDIVELQSKLRESIGQNKGGVSLSPIDKESVKEIDKARTSLEGLEQSLQQQVDTFGLSETAVLQYRLSTGDLSDEVQKLGADGQELVNSIIAQSEAFEQLKEKQDLAKIAEQEMQKEKQLGLQLTESMQTAEEIHNREISEYNRLLKEGYINQETFNRAVADSDKAYKEAKKGMNDMSVFAEQAARNMQDSFANYLYDPFKDGIEGMAKGFINSLRRMAAEAAASQIFDFIKDSAVNSGIGASISGFFGFADGGVMTSQGALPLKTYSTGGIANSPQLALYGEGRLPEAYVPLPDGRSIPVTVDMGNMTAKPQAGQTTVIVNVDAKGTSVEGNEKESKQLGQRFGQMIRSVLIDEKRPGGLLNS